MPSQLASLKYYHRIMASGDPPPRLLKVVYGETRAEFKNS